MHPNVRRAMVRGFFPGPKWRARVMAMTDEEVETFYDLRQEQLQEKVKTDEVHSERALEQGR